MPPDSESSADRRDRLPEECLAHLDALYGPGRAGRDASPGREGRE